MRHGWLAGPILFFRLIIIIGTCLIIATSFGGTSFGQSPGGGFQALSPEDTKEMEEIVRKFQKPLPEETCSPLLENARKI